MTTTMMKVYLDNNATTAMDRRVLKAMKPYFCNTYGNPNSLHSYGTAANRAVRESLKTMYRLLRADESDTVLITSGSTESNNTVIRGVYERLVRPRRSSLSEAAAPQKHSRYNRRPLFVTSAIEHPSVTEAFARIASDGCADVAVVQPRRDGTIYAEDVARRLEPGRTALVSVMWANNETGAINPVASIAQAVHRAGGLFHTDATQAVGKVPFPWAGAVGADFMSISAHKFHGPKGVGALYVKRGRPIHALEPLLHGGEQMAGLRAGTVNVPGLVGMARAAEIVMSEEGRVALRRVRWLRDRLEDGILKGVPNAVVVSPNRDQRVPNTLLVAFAGVEGEALIYGIINKLE